MKKLIAFLIFSLAVACGMPMMTITTHPQAIEASKNGQLVLFDGSIYKDGYLYGTFTKSQVEIQHDIVTYRDVDGNDVATLILKGVAPKTASLNLSKRKTVDLNLREFEIEVTEEDGAIYLIEHLYLKKSEKPTNTTITTKESDITVKTDSIDNQNEEKGTLTVENKSSLNVKTEKSGVVGESINLLYQFKKGDIWRYKAVENTDMKISLSNDMMGDMGGFGMPGLDSSGGMSQKFRSETEFDIKIVQVNSDNSASFEMVVSSFNVYLMPGKTLIASDQGISKGDLKVKGKITSKGVVTFEEDVYILVDKNDNKYLVSASVNKNSAQASATTGEEDVQVYASFDPKTGSVKAGVSIEKKKKLAKKELKKVTQEDKRVDILPKRYMELFLLPTESIIVSQKQIITAPMMSIEFLPKKYENSILNAQLNIKTDNKEMNSMITETESEAPQVGMKMDGSVDIEFNQKVGKLQNLKGKTIISMDMGMKMEITSDAELQLIPNK